jgi:hypothetical protein
MEEQLMSAEKKKKVIVSYKTLDNALSKPESVSRTEDELASVAETPEEKAAMLASLHSALNLLEERSAEGTEGVLVAADHRIASLLQTYAAAWAQKEGGKLEEAGPAGEYLEAKFDDKDYYSWARSFFSWWKGIVDHPWLDAPSLKTFGNDARLALLGDWGTGMYGAPACGISIENDPQGYDIRLHLGDVYYSGDRDEVAENFLAYWPKNKTGGEINRACNSNHEMYTGGHAYFNQILTRFEQSASYFALRNDHWLLVGLDTAYKGKDLHGDQVSWLENLIEKSAGRRVILFSHHQPFSFFDGGHPKITAKLGGLLARQKIFAWYWGHEHRCVLFERHQGWGLYGRCVGHGGYPYFRDKLADYPGSAAGGNGIVWRQFGGKNMLPGGLVLDGTNPYLGAESHKYGVQGYMSLVFKGAELHEIVHTPDGTELYNRRLI